jgi:hypothetical protein
MTLPRHIRTSSGSVHKRRPAAFIGLNSIRNRVFEENKQAQQSCSIAEAQHAALLRLTHHLDGSSPHRSARGASTSHLCRNKPRVAGHRTAGRPSDIRSLPAERSRLRLAPRAPAARTNHAINTNNHIAASCMHRFNFFFQSCTSCCGFTFVRI